MRKIDRAPGSMASFAFGDRDRQRRVPVDIHALACTLDRRLQRPIEADRAVTFQRFREASHAARHHGRGKAADVAVVDRSGMADEGLDARIGPVEFLVKIRRHAPGEFDDLDLSVRLGDQHVTAGRQTGHPGFDGLQGEGGGHRSVDGIAAR
ncbi:hypothetical protein LZK73_29275 (plasmid) [Neorhizobium galegae]|nr:hypothetical protein LZK73_29275 [Neorhizobium galegae]